MGWCQRPTEDGAFRLAVGSFIEEYSNKVKILNLDPNVRLDHLICLSIDRFKLGQIFKRSRRLTILIHVQKSCGVLILQELTLLAQI